MSTLRQPSQCDAAYSHRPLLFPAPPLLPPNSHFPLPNTHIAANAELLEGRSLINQYVRVLSRSHIYIYYIYTVLFSLPDFTGCAPQWKSLQGVKVLSGSYTPTAVLRSELSLAQQTGGTEAKRLFLPRERGNRREKRWTGAYGTSLLPFKLLKKK